MIEENNITDLIDRYLYGGLNEKELNLFEEKLRSDEIFRQEVEAQKAVIKSIQNNAKEDLRNFIKGISLEEKPKNKNISLLVKLSVAATILILISIGIVLKDDIFKGDKPIISNIDTTKIIHDTLIQTIPENIKHIANIIPKDTTYNKLNQSENKIYKTIVVPVKEIGGNGFGFAEETTTIDYIFVRYIKSTIYKNNYSYFNDTLSIYTDNKKLKEIKIQYNRSKKIYYFIIDKKKYVLVNSEKIHSL